MVSKAAIAAAEQRAAILAKQNEASTKQRDATRERAIQIATHKIDAMAARSPHLARGRLDVVPQFGADELRTGRVLQRGAFGVVRELRSVAFADAGDAPESGDARKEMDPGDTQDKRFIADHCVGDGGEIRYCVKVRQRAHF